MLRSQEEKNRSSRLGLTHIRVGSIMDPMTTRNQGLQADQENGKQGSFWRTALLLATSAAFGGIAVAIWNRRTLARIRQEISAGAAPQTYKEDLSGANVPD
jgi:hypothetical protein